MSSHSCHLNIWTRCFGWSTNFMSKKSRMISRNLSRFSGLEQFSKREIYNHRLHKGWGKKLLLNGIKSQSGIIVSFPIMSKTRKRKLELPRNFIKTTPWYTNLNQFLPQILNMQILEVRLRQKVWPREAEKEFSME